LNPAASTNPADSSNSKASSNPATKNRTRVPIRNISKTLFDKPYNLKIATLFRVKF